MHLCNFSELVVNFGHWMEIRRKILHYIDFHYIVNCCMMY